MKKLLLFGLPAIFAFAQEVEVEVEVEEQVEVSEVIEHAGLTREEISLVNTDLDYYIINDIISELTIFIDMDKATEYFIKSLDYYNRSLGIEIKKAMEKARKDKKTYYVNIVGGSDIPQHAFKGRNNVYKVDEYTNGQHTVFSVEPNGRIYGDHYESGDYGKLGRDGVSFEHAVKTFGASEIRKAVNRGKESNKKYDWEVTVLFPDMIREVLVFDTYLDYESWINRTNYPEKNYKVKKRKNNLKISKK